MLLSVLLLLIHVVLVLILLVLYSVKWVVDLDSLIYHADVDQVCLVEMEPLFSFLVVRLVVLVLLGPYLAVLHLLIYWPTSYHTQHLKQISLVMNKLVVVRMAKKQLNCCGRQL